MHDDHPGYEFGNEVYKPVVSDTGTPYEFGVSAISEEMFEVTVNCMIAGYVLRKKGGRYACLTRDGVSLTRDEGHINFQLSVLRVVNNYRKN